MSVLRFVLGAEVERERIDKVLARLLDSTSRATLQRWIEEGRVLLDGQVCRARDRVRAGGVIELTEGEGVPSDAKPDASVEFAVVHEDEDLLVVNKPPGLVVHPARGHWEGTLVNGLLARTNFGSVLDPRDPMAALRPGIVHRIDKDTSGLLVVAKNELAREELKAQIQAHSVERRYLALTLGTPRAGTLRSLHGRDTHSRLRFTTRVREGKSAVTELRVLERLCEGRAALVECRLETGRTHQIRVHLLELAGTPLLADALYRKPAPLAPDIEAVATRLGRQALHAGVLGFVHPRTRETLRFEVPLPEDMQRALDSLRATP